MCLYHRPHPRAAPNPEPSRGLLPWREGRGERREERGERREERGERREAAGHTRQAPLAISWLVCKTEKVGRSQKREGGKIGEGAGRKPLR